ncbi:LysR family transcriptional regulator [Cohaesibacter gelatinilyticus]|uniref:DNA-binding transcriptional regulator, LysR family n=1 Tax=Cohaesibacter gelatinilyticus TaxID=372072 RepID=A0A285NBC6_9HYPH|nr:LysR family transcriptional regulator [Cohaesibacter gelatinilyticus]SNZ06213.1 DNA-binding transcriptional regulator, LysR family [Cohaesibacter gelatinilyticus]
MDTDFLRSLVLVAEKGSIAEAARIDHMTPAAVGQRIAALERQMGCVLLDRMGHRAKPTQACLNLLPRARQILEDVSLLASDLDDQGLSGQLNFGVISTAMSGYLPKVMRDLRQQAPDIHLTISPGTSRALYEDVQTRDIDVALLVEPPFALSKALQFFPIALEPLCHISPEPLKDASEKTIARSIMSSSYICYDRQSWGGRIAAQYLNDFGLMPDILCDLDGPDSILHMVREGMGTSLLPLWPGVMLDTSDFHVTIIRNVRYARPVGLLSTRVGEKTPMINLLQQSLMPAPKLR